ncbi:T9SS sorting signal type C domain-containing protein [Moheibacter sediminis]|uniref:MAM domain-containing protein, meprin/A5/mu n=1 Tax=Moheibacter sediminis TaxID=1434700 RepID=A0A1W1Z4S4_9FLAO|nr:T9SS sorting signal type C domain-containing protein [Moheibacter sediminis]SMC43445.1 MAM domain-containing protein, meprin/A5/mu [Moheibacter sediminis]
MKENLFSSQKLMFLAILLFTFNSLSAQINFSQTFDTGSTVSAMGWSTTGYSPTTTNACTVRSVRGLLNSTVITNNLESPNQVSASNGNNISVSFNYKIINQTSPVTATPENFGSLQVQYSLNNGSTYTTAHTISSNHIPSTSCVTVNFTIPGTNVPSGNSFRLRFLGTHANGTYYIHLDDVVVAQATASPPNCNAELTFPLNGATNVPVTTSSLTWSTATGIPTGYRVRVGTTPGGTNIINNADAGNATSYPISLNYSTIYYVGITPYNANGNATGCTEYTFTTVAPLTATIPWSHDFINNSLPNGWVNNGFAIATSSRLPGAENNIIFKNLNASVSTGNFSTISVGEVQSGDVLNFIYRLGENVSPHNPPPTGSGNFIVSVSTDFGMTYTNVQTIPNNGIAGWQNFSLNLSAYDGEYVRIKITATRTLGDYFIGFDDFYIGQPIMCVAPEDLFLNSVGDDTAQISWSSISNAASYNWFVFSSGANPNTATPLKSGTVSTATVSITDLMSSTEYDFYVEANCGLTDGMSNLSEVFSFVTQCETINSFPFTETFESNSTSLDCWTMEYVNGNTNWSLYNGAAGGNITSAHGGISNALFYFNSFAVTRTKLVSPAFDIADMVEPKLTFWYANEQGLDPSDQNELKIYYKTSAAGPWTLIPGGTYNSNVSTWTYIELNLPSVSDKFYVAFEGTNHAGNGIVIDDVTISDFFSCPVTTWDGIAWSNGLPDIDKKAIIQDNLVLNANLEACELEITGTGRLEIPSGFSFTVKGLITNNAVADNFIVATDGNLIQLQDINNIGEITVFRDSQPFKRLDYTMWSSPVIGQNLFNFSPNTVNGVTNFPGSTGRIYVYDGSNEYVNPTPFTANSIFNQAEGYLFRAPNNWNATTATAYNGKFTGIPFNGDVSIATHADNFTSIGNPYPSNINADLLMSENQGILALYYWNNTGIPGNNYASYTFLGGSAAAGGSAIPDEFISVGQGFIVATEDASVKFTNNIRSSNDATFFKTELVERHRYWLNLKDSNNISYNGTLTGYMTGATNGVDNQIDGKLFNSTGTVLYSLIEGSNDKYVIQGRALPFVTSDVVNMGVRITTAGQFTISITQMDGLFAEGQQIYIHDKYLNVTHNLSIAYTFTSAVGEFNDRFEIVYEPAFCPSSTIWDGLTWSNGLPDFSKKAIIRGELILNSNLEACQLQVTQNGSLQIPSGFSFTVNDLVINNALAENFIVANGGNLIQINDVANVGEITVIRESKPMVRLDYTMWSSPVNNQNLFGFSPETVNGVTNYPGSTGRIYVYNGSNGYINPNPFTADAIMNEAVGYLFRSPNNWSAMTHTPYVGEFNGVANNGNVNVPTVANNFTSLGNPYPSNINADLLMTANTGVAAIYYWNNTGVAGNNYATYTFLGGTAAGGGSDIPGQFISVGQGFIVATTGSSVNFDNTMRVGDPANFFKADAIEKHRFWLDLTNENSEKYNQILVGYMTGATSGIDNQIDGKLFGYEGSALYSIINEEQFTVQGRALPFETADLVALGFKAVEAGKFVISLADFDGLFTEGGVTIYLKDNQTNTYHNLMESDYIFESEAGEFTSRFEIVYEEGETMGTGDLTSNSIQIYTHNDNIVVSSKSEKILSVELFDMVGRNIFRNEKVNTNHYEFKSQSKGVLIIKVLTQKGEIITKRVMNK